MTAVLLAGALALFLFALSSVIGSCFRGDDPDDY